MPKTNGSGQAKTLNPAQLDQLIDAAPGVDHRCLWSLMRWSGSRVSETLQLRWGAIHEERIVFVKSTTKTRATREVLIAPRLQQELLRYRLERAELLHRLPMPRELLFPGRWGGGDPMTRQWADQVLRNTMKGLELPSGCSLHSFRRSLATSMAAKGVGLKTITAFTGHRSLQQLQAYIDVSVADERLALAALE